MRSSVSTASFWNVPVRFPVSVDRLTRLAVMAAAAAALVLQTVLGMRLWQPFGFVVAGAFVLAFAATRWRPAAGLGAVMALTYVVPAIQAKWIGYYGASSHAVWTAALAGVIAALTGLRGWSMPPFWRYTLGGWALCVAIAFPIVVLREADFLPPLLNDYRAWTTSEGVTPAVAAAWTASVAAAHLLGVLLIDALFAAARARIDFRAAVLIPLAASALATAVVGIYQMDVDIAFFNETVFGGMGRAAGLMQDGNAFGVAVAMWAGGAVALATVSGRVGYARAGWALSATLFAAVWASGSRTALLAALIALAGAGVALWRSLATRRARMSVGAAGLAALALAIAVIAYVPGEAVGPIARVRSFVADNDGDVRRLIADLWNREGYGSASARIIEELPVTGAGLASFHALVLDYSKTFAERAVKSDNAQNWLRHLLAEMGILGAAACLVWLAGFIAFAAGWRSTRLSPAGWAIGGALAGLGFASMLGVPTQDVLVLATFWIFVFWFTQEAGLDVHAVPAATPVRAWIAPLVLVGLFGGATLYLGVTKLRPAARAQAAGWGYQYGFHDLDHSAVPPFRWTNARRAAAVFPAHVGYLRMTYWVHHPDVAERPVRVRVWRERELVIDEVLSSQVPRTVYLHNKGSKSWMTLRFAVDRLWRPQHEAVSRDIGLGVSDWIFSGAPPAGATLIR